MRSLGLHSVGSAHFKISTHPGWLCHPAAPPLPLCLLPLAFGETLNRRERRLAGNLCGNETMQHARGSFALPVPPPRGEQSALCLLVAQLDTAVEPSCSSSPRTGRSCCCCCTARVPVAFPVQRGSFCLLMTTTRNQQSCFDFGWELMIITAALTCLPQLLDSISKITAATIRCDIQAH